MHSTIEDLGSDPRRLVWFWRATLALPPLGALVGWVVDGHALLLTSAIAVMGIPYAIFAVVLWFVLRSLQRAREMVALAFAVPFLFLPFAFSFCAVLVSQSIVWTRWEDMVGDFKGLLPFIVGLGFLYTIMASVLFGALRFLGVFKVKSTPHGL